MIPIINQMSAAGVITLPGMMTGQILAGMDPREAATAVRAESEAGLDGRPLPHYRRTERVEANADPVHDVSEDDAEQRDQYLRCVPWIGPQSAEQRNAVDRQSVSILWGKHAAAILNLIVARLSL